MPDSHPSETASPDGVTPDEVSQQVRRWLDAAADVPVDRGSDDLRRLLTDPRGLDFALGVVDRVIRPEDAPVAARQLERLSRRLPQFLPWYLKSAIVAGGGFGIVAPRPIIPVARAVFRRLVQHLVADATPKRLETTLGRLRRPGVQVEIELLGETPSGDRAATRHLAELTALLARPDVDQLALTLASVTGPTAEWGFDEAVEHAVERLTPLFEQAARSRTRKLLTLELARPRDLDLTLAVFTRLLAQPALRELEAGLALPAALPDALPALERLTAWARERRAAGGAGVKVRLDAAAPSAAERAEALVQGRPPATWATTAESDAHALRLLDTALTAARTDAVRIGLAAHDLFLLAHAHLLARSRSVASRLELELRVGAAPGVVEVLRADAGGVLLRVPIVDPDVVDAAIPFLAQRLEQIAGEVAADLDDPAGFERAAARFTAARDRAPQPVAATHRTQDRSHADVPRAPEPFANAADTDPAAAGNRAWARGVLSRATTSALGRDSAVANRLAGEAAVAERTRDAARAGADWGRQPGSRRAEHLDRAGEVLAAFRGRLVEAMVAETATTFAAADGEVSAAIDAAHYAAARARELAGTRGAVFTPVPLTVVATSAASPVAGPAVRVLSALASGSSVLLRPDGSAARSAAVLVEALGESGIPRDVVGLVVVADDAAERALVTAPEVGRVLLGGSAETAQRYRSWRPDLPLLADLDGVNAVILTPSADLDRAVPDLVASAFPGAGRAPWASSIAILVGSLATSDRFRARLADAVSSLRVGSALDAETRIGPLLAPPAGASAGALTALADGERWLVKPRQLDDGDRLWSPGVREGVRPDGEFARTRIAAPVLGLVAAPDLRTAIALQNALGSGLAAGLHSLDAREVGEWLDAVRAGDLFVNRPLAGGVARRRPTGGWSGSTVGPGAKWGGPNTLVALGDWSPEPAEASEDLTLDGLDARVRTVIEAFQPVLDFPAFDAVRRAALADEETWSREFGRGHDPSALGVERNVLRYRPAEVVVRFDDGGSPGDLARVLCAGVRARAKVLVSSATPLPAALLPFVDDGTALGRSPLGILGVKVETDVAFRVRAAKGLPARIRLIGSDVASLTASLDGSLDTAVWAGPVTTAARLEMLPFLREQSVSITAHRFGIPDRDFQALVV